MKENESSEINYNLYDDSNRAVTVEPMYKTQSRYRNHRYYTNDDGTVDIKIQNIIPPTPYEELIKESIRITDPVQYAKEYVKIDEEKSSYKKVGFKKYFTKKIKSIFQILAKNDLILPILGGIALAIGITVMFKSLIIALTALPVIIITALNSKFVHEESLKYDFNNGTYYYKKMREKQAKQEKQSYVYSKLLKEWEEQQRLIPKKAVYLAIPEKIFQNIKRTSNKEWIKLYETLLTKQEAEQDLIMLKQLQKDNDSAKIFKDNIEENISNIKKTIKNQQIKIERLLKSIEEELDTNIAQEQQEELLKVLSSMEGKYTVENNDELEEYEKVYKSDSKSPKYVYKK